MMTSKHTTTLIGLAAVLAFAATQGCSSDESGTPSTPSAGSGVGGATAGAVGVSGGGSTAAGGATAGSGQAGAAAGSGGAAAGSGGAAAGSGGAAAGSGGASAGAAGMGGAAATATFTQVKAIMGASCGVGNCHNGNPHLNFQTPAAGLYSVLTTAIPAGIPHCNGTVPVVASNVQGSFLAQVIQGQATCKKNGNNENIPRMPDDCSATGNNPRPCLTADKIKTITDWIAAGAKND